MQKRSQFEPGPQSTISSYAPPFPDYSGYSEYNSSEMVVGNQEYCIGINSRETYCRLFHIFVVLGNEYEVPPVSHIL